MLGQKKNLLFDLDKESFPVLKLIFASSSEEVPL